MKQNKIFSLVRKFYFTKIKLIVFIFLNCFFFTGTVLKSLSLITIFYLKVLISFIIPRIIYFQLIESPATLYDYFDIFIQNFLPEYTLIYSPKELYIPRLKFEEILYKLNCFLSYKMLKI